ncbi:hypothetical protein B4N89_15760 [Embleya scabrispora]|uniref:Uncharacterized protein n=1 Tax=Embleya scabrispora TaxID=159449 RepID=A0A1T3NZE9_9ACTN|nr:hypothetical protein B4N89_15760 [Embleya scabrispora]
MVRARADRFSIALSSIRMVVTDRLIGYDGPGDNVVHDTQLIGISQALGQEEAVIEADAPTRSGAVLRCSFSHHVSSARGARSQVPLDELIGTTARLLYDLSSDEDEKLMSFLGDDDQQTISPWNQPPLFES